MAATALKLGCGNTGVERTISALSEKVERLTQSQNYRCKFYLDRATLAEDQSQAHNPGLGIWRSCATADFWGRICHRISTVSRMCKIIHCQCLASMCSSSTEGSPQKDIFVPWAACLVARSTQGYNQHKRSEGWSGFLLFSTKPGWKICRFPLFSCSCSDKKVSRTHLNGYTYLNKII